MNSSAAKQISECFIKPKYEVEDSKNPYHLTPWGLYLLSVQYMQNGLLFVKPQLESTENLIASLKESFSLALVHFYPLAGQLTTHVNDEKHESSIFLECNKGPGAKFIHAISDVTISDILSPTYVPPVVQSFFDCNKLMNHDGHTKPLLSVQVTELLDGVFIGVSMNHVVADGASLWQFINIWSEIHRKKQLVFLPYPPIHNSFFPNPDVLLPFTHPDEFISRYEAPQLRERIFHFSSDSVKKLKQKANEESNTNNISSLQTLTALIWKSIVKVRQASELSLNNDIITNCGLAINNRHRLDPPLPTTFFRNSIGIIQATTSVGKLLEHNLGWAASLVHQSVTNHNNQAIRDQLKEWKKRPYVLSIGKASDSFSVILTNSPRFDMFGNDFGFGKPLAVRSGCTNKVAGNLAIYPGNEGGASVDIEVYLPHQTMTDLESDKDFMAAVSRTPPREFGVSRKAWSWCLDKIVARPTTWKYPLAAVLRRRL